MCRVNELMMIEQRFMVMSRDAGRTTTQKMSLELYQDELEWLLLAQISNICRRRRRRLHGKVHVLNLQLA